MPSLLLILTLWQILGALWAPKTAEATLVFAGDAMQHQAQLDAARHGSCYDYSRCFTAIRGSIDTADWAVVNLETTLPGARYTGYPCFGSPDAWAVELQKTGFDMALTANNHCLDRGARAVRRTLRVLDSLQMRHVGTYASAKARSKSLPVVTDVKGYKIGWLCYTYGTNGIKPRDGVVVDYIDTAQIRRDLAITRAACAEMVVVALHWGIEYQLTESEPQQRLAAWLQRQGVDIVLGGHPHVIQPSRLAPNPYTGRPGLVIYSLGNLISGMRTYDTRRGQLCTVTLRRDSTGQAYVARAQLTPVQTLRDFTLSVGEPVDL